MHQSAATGEATPSVWRSPTPRSAAFLALVVATLLLGVVGISGLSTIGAQSGTEAADYVARINALRSSVGAQPVGVDGQLSGLAQSCAERIAAAGSLIHTSNLSTGLTSSWTKLGENIGTGPRNDTIWTAFVHSSQHYANLVDPAFNRVGVGIAYAGGSQWTCHRFMALSGGGDQPAAARAPAAAARPAAPKTPKAATPPPAADPVPVIVLPPAPMPGPPPPADAVRVATVLQAMHVLSAQPAPSPQTPTTDSARVAAVLQAVHALSSA